MIDTKTRKQYIFLWDERYSIEGFLITNVGQLSAGIIHVQESFPLLWTFTPTTLQTEEEIILLLIIVASLLTEYQ